MSNFFTMLIPRALCKFNENETFLKSNNNNKSYELIKNKKFLPHLNKHRNLHFLIFTPQIARVLFTENR